MLGFGKDHLTPNIFDSKNKQVFFSQFSIREKSKPPTTTESFTNEDNFAITFLELKKF